MEVAVHVGVRERGHVLGVVLIGPAHFLVVSGRLGLVKFTGLDEGLNFELNLPEALETRAVTASSLLVLFCLGGSFNHVSTESACLSCEGTKIL